MHSALHPAEETHEHAHAHAHATTTPSRPPPLVSSDFMGHNSGTWFWVLIPETHLLRLPVPIRVHTFQRGSQLSNLNISTPARLSRLRASPPSTSGNCGPSLPKTAQLARDWRARIAWREVTRYAVQAQAITAHTTRALDPQTCPQEVPRINQGRRQHMNGAGQPFVSLKQHAPLSLF